MRAMPLFRKTLLSLSLAAIFITGCASAPKTADGAAAVRQQLMQLQADRQLALLAPLAIKDAEQAVVLAELNARPSDRGLVITLGDVLFDTAQASLKNGSSNHLDKLALFLNNYPERTAQIEGHTDEVGSDAANMLLSQRRADTVKAFLVAQGIAGSRLNASGKGEGVPLASNATAEGRAQNRRVEVIIANAQE